MSGDQLAAAIVDNHAGCCGGSVRVLELACAWADLHAGPPLGIEYPPLVERACMVGGRGTADGVGVLCRRAGRPAGHRSVAARALVADALDLRYRLPLLWERCGRSVRAWQARKVAEQTRPLSWDAAWNWMRRQRLSRDDALAPVPDRFWRPRSRRGSQLAAEREKPRPEAQDVWACDSDDGLKTLVAKARRGMRCGSWPR